MLTLSEPFAPGAAQWISEPFAPGAAQWISEPFAPGRLNELSLSLMRCL
jgi:hypothetical protein